MMKIAPQLRGLSTQRVMQLMKEGKVILDGDWLVPTIAGATVCTNNFEGGTVGQLIKTTDTGSGTAWDGVNPTTGTDPVNEYQNTFVANGSQACRMATHTATAGFSRLQWTVTKHGAVAIENGRIYFGTDTTPPSQGNAIVQLYDQTPTKRVDIQFLNSPARAIRVITVGNSTSTYQLSLNTLYRIEWTWDVVAGTVTVYIYQGHSTTLIESIQRTDAVVQTTCNRIDLGQLGTLANYPSSTGWFFFDEIVSGAASLPGPAVTNQYLRPDADNAVGGWATAPLWSKVDEASAGGDVITATAS